jgi:hypothetical protein
MNGKDLTQMYCGFRSVGRGTKHLADLTLQAGLPSEAAAHYAAAVDVLKGANDWLWLGGMYQRKYEILKPCSLQYLDLHNVLSHVTGLSIFYTSQPLYSLPGKCKNFNS